MIIIAIVAIYIYIYDIAFCQEFNHSIEFLVYHSMSFLVMNSGTHVFFTVLSSSLAGNCQWIFRKAKLY